MRAGLAIPTLALFIISGTPASAEMCGGDPTKAGGPTAMCGASPATTVPTEGEQQSEPKKAGCSCCQNIAMMDKKMDNMDAEHKMEMPAQPMQ